MQGENTLSRGHPRYPRKPGEKLLDYIRRLSELMAGESTGPRSMPDQRMPYREPEEPEGDREPGEDG